MIHHLLTWQAPVTSEAADSPDAAKAAGLEAAGEPEAATAAAPEPSSEGAAGEGATAAQDEATPPAAVDTAGPADDDSSSSGGVVGASSLLAPARARAPASVQLKVAACMHPGRFKSCPVLCTEREK